MPDDERPDSEQDKLASENDDEALLQEIRDRFTYAKTAWSDIFDEAKTDRRYVLGDPWEDEDKKARKDAGRPCINHDELNQYLNQYVNGIRQSPPGIKYDPTGEGSSEKTAELRESLVRSIETNSDAQSAYCCAAEDAAEGGYGFFKLTRRYESNKSFNQNIAIDAVLNPDAVLYDPDCKKPDWSDANYCFVLDPIPRTEFVRTYRGAKKVNFSAEDMKQAPDWVQDKTILVAEYWRVEVKTRTLLLLDDDTETIGFADELGGTVDGKELVMPDLRDRKRKRELRIPIKKSREVAIRTITQFITNGVEILKKIPQPGTIIPIIPVVGKEMYVDDGTGAKRKLISLVRLARDPQMSLAYLNSLEMEEAGQTPKIPYVGYKGQFESDAETWEGITKEPHSFAQIDPIVDAGNGQVLPLPRREQFTPNFQAYEVAKDSCRRAIQAAMGIIPLPTSAQKDSEKSGIAIEKIQNQETVGSFHFTANLHRALRLAGKVMEEWFPIVYDSKRKVPLTQADGKRKLVTINTAQPYQGKEGLEHYPVTEADHDVAISVAPSSASTFQAAKDFLEGLMKNLPTLQLPPPVANKLLAMLIQMQTLGPKGDQMAELISPPDPNNLPPQAQAAIAQSQQQIAAMNELVQKLKGELDKLMIERQGRVIENEYKLKLQDQKGQQDYSLQQLRNDIDVLKSLITAKTQRDDQEFEMYKTFWTENHRAAHDIGMQKDQQAHEADQAEKAQAAAVVAAQQQPDQGQPEAGAPAQ